MEIKMASYPPLFKYFFRGIFVNDQRIERHGEWVDGNRIKWLKKNSKDEFVDDDE